MNPDRRYDEEEIAEIFRLASEPDGPLTTREPARGLTLRQLQEVGAEVGMRPETIARAAASLDIAAERQPAPTIAGIRVGVSRTIDLPRPLSDDEWDRLVVTLRDVFGATGQTRRDGGLRMWRNGNLHAVLEPTATGQRLRLSTLKGNAGARLLGGLGVALVGGTLLVIQGVMGLPDQVLPVAFITAVGGGVFGSTAIQLPRWASRRERQMEAVAQAALELAGS